MPDTASILSTAPQFIRRVLSALSSASLPLPPSHIIDHLCYRTASSKEYSALKSKFTSHGVLLTESIVGGREIATFKLHPQHAISTTWNTALVQVDVVELPSPKPGRNYSSGWEHVEVVVDDLEGLIQSREHAIMWDLSAMDKPVNRDARVDFTDSEGKFSVKFHEQTLEQVIEWEKAAERDDGRR